MRIFVADDSDIVRRGVVGILSAETDWTICGEARDGLEAIRSVPELAPDIVLLDISMPGANGLEVTRKLREYGLTGQIVIISQNDADQLLPSAIAAGANACVDKSHLVADLVATIKKLRLSVVPTGDGTEDQIVDKAVA